MTQSGLAFSANGREWFLINASPDLRTQIETFPALQPQASALRYSPIEGVLLTNADLDHVLGLFLLREGESMSIHATQAVRETLSKGLRMEAVLNSYGGVNWREISFQDFMPLVYRSGKPSGLAYRAIALASSQPLYFREGPREGDQSIAWEIRDESTGVKWLMAPDVERITPALQEAMEEADAVFFDGTFWSDDELQRVKGASRTALEMGHLPLQTHSLKLLRSLRARHKILLHINNTNPILRPGSPERVEVETAGITIGQDGLEFEL